MSNSNDYSNITNVNLSINTPQKNTDSGGSPTSSSLNNSIKNVHGFVHGHIHRHKDHTHIHGHIHSHDLPKKKLDQNQGQSKDQDRNHQQNQRDIDDSAPEHGEFPGDINPSGPLSSSSNSSLESSIGIDTGRDAVATNSPSSFTSASSSLQTNINPEFCPLEELPMCEVLCTELDDCYFVNCDDAQLQNCIEPEQLDSGRLETDKQMDADVAKAVNEGSEKNTQTSSSRLQTDSMCCYETPHNKSHHNNLCEPDNDKTLFDHIFNEFRNANGAPVNQKAQRNPDLIDIHYPHEIHPLANTHKAFFHANVSEQNLINEFGDYDFHFQFDNSTDANLPSKQVFDQPSSTPSSITGTEDQARVQELNDIISCKWENCYSHLNTDGLVDHIFNEHIKETSHQHQPMDPTGYSCEWLNCNHTFNELDTFLEHLNGHRNEALFSEPEPLIKTENQSPIKTEYQDDTKSTNLLRSLMKEPYDPSISKSITKSPSPIKKENIDNIQISDLRVKKKNDLIDPEFTCKWETEVQNGEAIPCNRTHKSAGDLQEHLIKDHIGSGLPCYHCNWVGCERHNGKNFPQRQKLLRHIHVHTNFKPWKCSVCNSCFAVEAMLVQHLRVHSGEKPFKCSTCGKKFATSSSLSIHNRVHTGEKPLTCKYPGCNKKFSESSNLTKHMKTHAKCFECEICDAQFVKKAVYMKHMKDHESDIYNYSVEPPLKMQKFQDPFLIKERL